MAAALAIQPIPTRYRGYHFRSRLEARYAVFLDALGASWEYESEGYDLPFNGYYLPDFRVSKFPILRRKGRGVFGTSSWEGFELIHADFWLEVKGQSPSNQDVGKMTELCVHSRSYGYIGCGDVFDGVIKACDREACPDYHIWSGFVNGLFSATCYPWKTYTHAGLQHATDDDAFGVAMHDPLLHGEFNAHHWLDAANAACSARFEHGESGAT